MNDRELLELAAKAAGIDGRYADGVIWYRNPFGDEVGFNPCKDDGDAFRLAVKLNLNVDLAYGDACVVRVFNETHFFQESTSQDPFAATRRAIVRAAAAIGKAMP